jgi:5-aminolevulinate synthase
MAEREGLMGQWDRLTVIQGTLAKGFGVVGGYIAGSATFCNFIHSYGSGFIFSISMPPAVAAAALESVHNVRSHPELRTRPQERSVTLKEHLSDADFPLMPSISHIVPVRVGDPVMCKSISDRLTGFHGIYVQPINYPTVARGTKRLRFTPSPLHSDNDMDALIDALREAWAFHCLKAVV